MARHDKPHLLQLDIDICAGEVQARKSILEPPVLNVCRDADLSVLKRHVVECRPQHFESCPGVAGEALRIERAVFRHQARPGDQPHHIDQRPLASCIDAEKLTLGIEARKLDTALCQLPAIILPLAELNPKAIPGETSAARGLGDRRQVVKKLDRTILNEKAHGEILITQEAFGKTVALEIETVVGGGHPSAKDLASRKAARPFPKGFRPEAQDLFLRDRALSLACRPHPYGQFAFLLIGNRGNFRIALEGDAFDRGLIRLNRECGRLFIQAAAGADVRHFPDLRKIRCEIQREGVGGEVELRAFLVADDTGHAAGNGAGSPLCFDRHIAQRKRVGFRVIGGVETEVADLKLPPAKRQPAFGRVGGQSQPGNSLRRLIVEADCDICRKATDECIANPQACSKIAYAPAANLDTEVQGIIAWRRLKICSHIAGQTDPLPAAGYGHLKSIRRLLKPAGRIIHLGHEVARHIKEPQLHILEGRSLELCRGAIDLKPPEHLAEASIGERKPAFGRAWKLSRFEFRQGFTRKCPFGWRHIAHICPAIAQLESDDLCAPVKKRAGIQRDNGLLRLCCELSIIVGKPQPAGGNDHPAVRRLPLQCQPVDLDIPAVAGGDQGFLNVCLEKIEFDRPARQHESKAHCACNRQKKYPADDLECNDGCGLSHQVRFASFNQGCRRLLAYQ